MSILTKEERAQIKERTDAATEGPWFNWVENNAVYAGVAIDNDPGCVSPSGEPIYEDYMGDCNPNGPEDAEFIAHARTDLLRALDTIDALEAERDITVETGRAQHAEIVELEAKVDRLTKINARNAAILELCFRVLTRAGVPRRGQLVTMTLTAARAYEELEAIAPEIIGGEK